MIRRYSWFAILLLLAGLPAAAPLSAQEAAFDGRPLAAWVAQLESDDPDARRQALYALGRIGPPAAAACLEQVTTAVDDIKQEVRWYAVDTLGRFGSAAAPAVPTIVAGVRDPANDRFFALAAFTALGRIGPPAAAALPLLREAMGNSDLPYRAAAAAAAWRIEPAEPPLRVLREVLAQREQPEGAILAAQLLQEIGPEHVPPEPLLAALEHPEADVRRRAAAALGAYSAETLAPPLTAQLAAAARDPGNNTIAELAAARYLVDDLGLARGASPSPAVRDLLAALPPLLAREEAETRRAAADVLARGGSHVLPALLDQLTGPGAEGARLALLDWEELSRQALPSAELLERELAPRLLAGLQAETAERRLASLRLLAALEAAPAVPGCEPVLRELLRGGNAAERRQAARALQTLTGAGS